MLVYRNAAVGPRRTVAVGILFVLAGCSGSSVKTVWDTQYDFSSLATYDWAAKEAESGQDLPYDALDRAIRSAVDRQLTAAGFRRSGDSPSFLVTYYLGVEEVTRIDDDEYYGRGWSGYWGYGWYGPAGVNVSLYDPGAITVDVISTEPAIGLLWRGVEAGVLSERSPSSMEGAATSSIERMFKDFPPRSND